MNRYISSSLFLLSLFVMACLAASKIVRAQQVSDPAGAGTYSLSPNATSENGMSLPSGAIPSSTTALAGGSAQGLASKAGAAVSTPANEKFARESDSRSAWLAGSSSVGALRTAGWKNGPESFTPSGASWTAGGSSFRIDRQAGGIWRANMASGVPSVTSSPSTDLLSLPVALSGFSTGLTPKGAGMIKAARLSSPFVAKGIGSAGGGQSGFGRAVSPFASHVGSLGTSGNGAGATSTQQTPDSEAPTDPSLNDSLGPDSGKSLSGPSH